ncbi:hypothetical protein L9F63_019217, partial [Diploptera punctata]
MSVFPSSVFSLMEKKIMSACAIVLFGTHKRVQSIYFSDALVFWGNANRLGSNLPLQLFHVYCVCLVSIWLYIVLY